MVPEGIDDLPIIQKGHDPEVCFRIIPVKCHSTECFSWDSVEACESAKISLDEFDVDGFLRYFFRKHFDKTLIYNQQRHDDVHGIKNLGLPAEFEWYLTHNFYSYDAMRAMLDDIRRVMDDMRCGGLDAVPPELSKDIKGWFYAIGDDSVDRAAAEKLAYANPFVAMDYFRSFICHMEKMMEEHPDWPLISIIGP